MHNTQVNKLPESGILKVFSERYPWRRGWKSGLLWSLLLSRAEAPLRVKLIDVSKEQKPQPPSAATRDLKPSLWLEPDGEIGLLCVCPSLRLEVNIHTHTQWPLGVWTRASCRCSFAVSLSRSVCLSFLSCSIFFSCTCFRGWGRGMETPLGEFGIHCVCVEGGGYFLEVGECLRTSWVLNIQRLGIYYSEFVTKSGFSSLFLFKLNFINIKLPRRRRIKKDKIIYRRRDGNTSPMPHITNAHLNAMWASLLQLKMWKSPKE